MKRLNIEALTVLTNVCVCVCVECFSTVTRPEQVQTYNHTQTHTLKTTCVFESHWTAEKVFWPRLWTWQGRARERRALKQKNWWLTKLSKTPLLPSRLTGNGMFSFFFPLAPSQREKLFWQAPGSRAGRVFVCGTIVSLPLRGSGAVNCEE